MTSACPDVLVVIPAYNAGAFIQDAVSSALAQGPFVRVLVSDNSSEDDTVERIEALANNRVRVHVQPENLGAQANGNWLLDNADGDVIAMLCADDVFLPGHLSKQVAVLQGDSRVRLMGCNMFETGPQLDAPRLVQLPCGKWRGPRLTGLCAATLTNLFGGPSNFTFRRADIGTTRVDSAWNWLSDLNFAAALVGDGFFVNPGHAGYLYRRHLDTDSARLESAMPTVLLEEWARFVSDHEGRRYPWVVEELLAQLSDGDVAHALALMRPASIVRPLARPAVTRAVRRLVCRGSYLRPRRA